MYHLQALRRLCQPWPRSPRGGDHLEEEEEKKKREREEEFCFVITNQKVIHLLGSQQK